MRTGIPIRELEEDPVGYEAIVQVLEEIDARQRSQSLLDRLRGRQR